MAKKRQSTTDTLTAGQRAFLHADSNELPCPTTQVPASRPDTPKVVKMPRQTTNSRQSGRPEPSPQIRLPSRRGQALQSVSLRFHPGVVRALRKAAGERYVDYDEPFTQQGIAEEAITTWLEDRGYSVG